jgi:hypothetical protein
MRACGDCRFFRRHTLGSDGSWVGDCRHQPQRGDFGPDAPICISYLSVDAPIPAALPEQPTRHRSRSLAPARQPLVRRTGLHAIPASHPHPESAESQERGNLGDLGEINDMTRDELKALLREALEETDTQLAPKWEGGTVVLKPRDPALQPREIPIDQLLHKVVMVRDRLRVLEQKINAHPKLSDAEKVDFQQYVTRCYGSLTTFNQLFQEKSDHFVGDRGDD